MTWTLNLSGHTDSDEARDELLAAAQRFASHLRKVPGLGSFSATIHTGAQDATSVNLNEGHGTADAPVKPDGPTLPEGWSRHPDGGYVDAEGKRVAARDSDGNVTEGVDEVVSISRADTPDADSG